MYTFDRFKAGPWSMVILAGGKVIFKSRARGIKPLIRYLRADGDRKVSTIIYDKYVGRAAALLMTFLNVSEVFTPVISQAGRETLENYNIPFHADSQVQYLMGFASDETCRWEKITVGKTPAEFWNMLNANPR